MEDNLSFIFMKNGFNVSQTSNNSTVISLNEQGINTLKLSCTLTEYTDRETILIPYRVEDKGSIETVITQTTDPEKVQLILSLQPQPLQLMMAVQFKRLESLNTPKLGSE